MTSLNVEPAGPNVRPAEPTPPSSASPRPLDSPTVFESHLRKAQPPEPVNNHQPNATGTDQPHRPAAAPAQDVKPQQKQDVDSAAASGSDEHRGVKTDDSDSDGDQAEQSTETAEAAAADVAPTVSPVKQNDDESRKKSKDPNAKVDKGDKDKQDEADVQGDATLTQATNDVAAVTVPDTPDGKNGQPTNQDSNQPAKESPSEVSVPGRRTKASSGNNPLAREGVVPADSDGDGDSNGNSASDSDPVDTKADANATNPDENAGNDGQGRAGRTALPSDVKTTQQGSTKQDATKAADSADRTDKSADRPNKDDIQQRSESDVAVKDKARSAQHRSQDTKRPNPQLIANHPTNTAPTRQETASAGARGGTAPVATASDHDMQHLGADKTVQKPNDATGQGSGSTTDVKSRDAAGDGRPQLPPQLRTQFGPRANGEPARGDGLSHVQRARLMQRVGNAFRMANEQGGVVRLRLSPAELGSLRLEVAMRDGMMTARMEVETSHARTAVVENLGTLRQRLAQHNVEIQRFDVEVRDQSAGELPQQHDGWTGHDNDQRSTYATGSRVQVDDNLPERVERRGPRRPDDNSQLNLVI